MAKKTKKHRRRSTRGESTDTLREENEDLTVTDNTAPHITKADLVDNITEKAVVLDICRTPWSWTYKNDPGEHHRAMIQGTITAVRGKHEKGTVTDKIFTQVLSPRYMYMRAQAEQKT